MALEIFYSALHWSKRAERFATSAANSARTAQTAAAQSSQASGKIIQLGFDGAMEDGQLVFKHSPAGVDIPYDLLDDYEYEIDMVYQGSDLADDVELVVKNGADTINFVSALHRDSTTPVTVKDMKSVMRYDESTGYRWLFKAAFKVTPLGDKVLLLYPVVAAKDYSDRTNCITEIPQDIKLELNNGTLTLKAGSKVYVPNGAGVFDEVTIDSDKSTAGISYFRPCFVMYDHVSKTISIRDIQQCQSGTSTPSSAISGVLVYYNTSENKVYLYTNNAWVAGAFALPLCVVNMQTATPYITSIDQVFNGFGYIGSTVFALPGVKGLIPNGRNADGTLNNIEFRTSYVETMTFDYTREIESLIVLKNNAINASTVYEYNEEENVGYNTGTNSRWDVCIAGKCKLTNGVVSNFHPKQPLQAVDRNDSSWLSGIGMPSERYIDLTLGGSGAGYTAPANGYFTISKRATGAAQYVIINMFYDGETAKRISNASYSPGSGYGCLAWLPVRKGDRVHISYTAQGETACFMFVYAEGEN